MNVDYKRSVQPNQDNKPTFPFLDSTKRNCFDYLSNKGFSVIRRAKKSLERSQPINMSMFNKISRQPIRCNNRKYIKSLEKQIKMKAVTQNNKIIVQKPIVKKMRTSDEDLCQIRTMHIRRISEIEQDYFRLKRNLTRESSETISFDYTDIEIDELRSNLLKQSYNFRRIQMNKRVELKSRNASTIHD